jgi:hypothetical protein
MSRVAHFEINADDPERAVAFYRAALGWEISKWAGPIDYWLAITGPADEPGINGGIMQRSQAGAGTWNTVEVESLDGAVAKVVAAGGSVMMPKEPIPGVGYQAYCLDTEGNVFGLHQADDSAR